MTKQKEQNLMGPKRTKHYLKQKKKHEKIRRKHYQNYKHTLLGLLVKISLKFEILSKLSPLDAF
jgi:hypothetical protein